MGKVSIKRKKCEIHGIVLPDIKEVDSFHLRCQAGYKLDAEEMESLPTKDEEYGFSDLSEEGGTWQENLLIGKIYEK